MALFAEQDSRPRRRETRRRNGWVALAVALAIGVVLSFTPAPYVIEKPGPVFDTLGTTLVGDVEVPMITIEGAETFPSSGALKLLTVSVTGNREHLPSWLDVASAWFVPSQAVLPIDKVFPSGVTTEQRTEQNQLAMVDSQMDAVAAALTALGEDIPRGIDVQSLQEDSPAEGILKPGDDLVAVNGTPINDVDELRALLTAAGAGTPIAVGIIRDGVTQTVQVVGTAATAEDGTDTVVLGILVAPTYEFPIDVSIQIDKVGGPSAGMMFALGIMDRLTPEDMTGGNDIAGTGSISADGEVGAIGGIRQKMFGAKGSGSDWFLAPADNCNEVSGHIPSGLTVIAVSTLTDAVNAVEVIAADGDIASLPSCDAS